MENNIIFESLYTEPTSARTRKQLRQGEAQLYYCTKPNVTRLFSVNVYDSEEIAALAPTHVDLQRNPYNGEVYIIFNNERCWQPNMPTDKRRNVRISKQGFINALASALGVTYSEDGATTNQTIQIRKSLVPGVYIATL